MGLSAKFEPGHRTTLPGNKGEHSVAYILGQALLEQARSVNDPNLDFCRELLTAGADVTVTCDKGHDAREYAARYCHTDLVEMLDIYAGGIAPCQTTWARIKTGAATL